jgi:LacI family transcriptional regulator
MSRKKITMEMLADELGLSRITVSKALRGLPGMSLETRTAVLELAEKKGYMTREQKESTLFEHTSLMSLQPRRFLMVLEDGQPSLHNVQLELMKGLNERYHGTSSRVSPIFIPAKLVTKEAFDEWAEESGVIYADGVFIPPMIPQDMEEWLLQLPVHRILLNFPPIGAQADSVIWDVYESVRQAVRVLIGNGHRNILYIGDTRGARGFRLRWSAFAETMADYGLPVREEDHLTYPFHSSYPWQEDFQTKLKNGKPTAILNTIEGNLPWVYYLCSQAGLRIPEDCSLVSLDIIDEPRSPGLCYFYMPIRETGYRAADRMIWRIANPGRPYEHIRLQGHYVEGTSIKPQI